MHISSYPPVLDSSLDPIYESLFLVLFASVQSRLSRLSCLACVVPARGPLPCQYPRAPCIYTPYRQLGFWSELPLPCTPLASTSGHSPVVRARGLSTVRLAIGSRDSRSRVRHPASRLSGPSVIVCSPRYKWGSAGRKPDPYIILDLTRSR